MTGPNELAVRTTAIPGLLVLDLTVHGDARGWFKENGQRAKMVALGLPDFAPVQHSVAYNAAAGVTRGIHAEPWDKLVSIAHGRAFCAWVDLREGPRYGAVHTEELDEGKAVFVPRGVGNSYQTLIDGTVYSYLVNAHWSPEASYSHLNLADESAAIPWPIPLGSAEISEKDRNHPRLAQASPVTPARTVILGATGQLGTALQAALPHAHALSRQEVDLSDPSAIADLDFSDVGVVINAAAFTAVDQAETRQGRAAAWAVNATAVAALARAAQEHRFTLVHYSTDYVFDGHGGSGPGGAYLETDPISPVSAYGQSKAAGEAAVQQVPQHYLIRTSWVVGEGRNFVRTMRSLAERGVQPNVVEDQVGRLTFTSDLAAATVHLLDSRAPYGTYHATNSGEPASWAEIARRVYTLAGRDTSDVHAVTTSEYLAGYDQPVAPRPSISTLDLTKLEVTGLMMPGQWGALESYLDGGQ
ncbi:dTDP-4-dehydrorhamnose reductase [Sanguibacter sp. Z1732]|uniref:dTDP-4-dehydrorhamnose reductase n=1 Tax=Sanguibacter sp. Z1732 TaxID=3435412 RepID=UPI003D9CB904